MIPRKGTWRLFTTCTLLLVTEVKLQSGRAYDTNEWIPVIPSSLQASSSEIVEQKTASDRLLNLDTPDQKFFPDEEYEYRKHRPSQVQSFLRETPVKKGVEHPRPRKLKHPSEYKFETPPPPPLMNQPQINYYNGENLSPYVYEEPTTPRVPKPATQQSQHSYYVPRQQLSNQRPITNSYVAVPNVKPQVPAPNAPNLYEQYQLPFNATFYQSLNPVSLNNELYQAISNNNQTLQQHLTANLPQQINLPHQNVPVASKPRVDTKPDIEQESVQLVYIPAENLKPNQPATQDIRNLYQQFHIPRQESTTINTVLQTNQDFKYKLLDQPKQENLISNYESPYLQQRQEPNYQTLAAPRQEKLVSLQNSLENKQQRLESIQQDFIQQALQAHKLQQQLEDDINPLKQNPITETPRSNRKPHQPPLAVFMESQKKAEISDVLNSLRDAKTISVQDAVTRDSPKIFVGPSNLDSPEGYTKFPLPYLNNVNGNRIERKIDQLPFFVAPVNYKTPPGYAKIPLPSPHVGSVVVSVPVSPITTPEPVLLQQNQINPFTFTSVGYSPLDPLKSSRPVQNYLDNYETSGPGSSRYQSTPAPHVTESSVIPPVRDIFNSPFAPRQPEVYYTEQNPQQTYRDSAPTLDIYRPQLQETDRYISSQENRRPTSTTVKPEDLLEKSQLPNVNSLELAINEFELHQINDQFEQPIRKVKHSTTRRPQNRNNYEDDKTVSSTRTPVSRGRQTFEADSTTERTVSRGRVRGRGRGSSSRTTTTTATTTNPVTVKNDRYTVLEEFEAKEPVRSPSTENYGGFSAEAKTESPGRSTTPFNNAYLQVQRFDTKRPEVNVENSRSQTRLDESFYNRSPQPPQPDFENDHSQIELDNGSEEKRLQTKIEISRSQTQLDDIQSQTQFDRTRSRTNELKSPKTKSVISSDIKEPQTVQQPNQYYQGNAEIENIPASVYNLGQLQTYDSTAFDFDRSRNTQEPSRNFNNNVQSNEDINTDISRPLQNEARPTPSHRFSSEVVSYENREPNQQLRPQEIPTYLEFDRNVNNEPVDERPLAKIDEDKSEEQKPKPQSVEDPSGFLENLFQPNFDRTYISLQDQAVRSLLVPNLLAPSTKPLLPSTPRSEEIISSTEAIVELPLSTEAELKTTTRATRTRGRGRAKSANTSTTASSATRRTANRRRPVSRTSTERIASSTQYSSIEDTERSDSNTKQNYGTRSRPAQIEISDRILTTENDVRVIKEPTVESNFEAVKTREPPQSYMQFEHAIDEQQIITINPDLNQDIEIKEYHQVYSLPSQTTTEKQQYILEYENTRTQPTPVVDIQISHVMPEVHQRNPEVITTTEDEQHVRYNNANIRSGGVLNNNKPVTTTKEPTTKIRGRARGRSRFATTMKTTARPVSRISTSAPLRTTTQEEEKEYYGFIRQPAYSQKNIQTSLINEDPAVHFVGEIRPKYTSRKTTLQPPEELDSAETPRPRIRARTRAPTRKTTNSYRQSDNDVNSSKASEQVTRRSGTSRGRVRGSTHYRAPENQKRESEDEDFASQNYPIHFLQKLDASSPKPTTTAFQITIDPLDQQSDDQSPYSSIYRPKFVPKPDGWADPNGLPVEEKPLSTKPDESTSTEEYEANFSTEEPQALPIIQTTQYSDEFYTQFVDAEVGNIMSNSETIRTSPRGQSYTTLQPTEEPITQRKNRRKGTWKLVRHRPVDPLEVSESQNYETVLNAFESIRKVDPYTKRKSSQDKFNKNGDSYDKQSFNFNDFNTEIDSYKVDNIQNQNSESQKDVVEVVTVVTENDSTNTEYTTDTSQDELVTTTQSSFKTQENIFDTLYEMFGIFNKPENKKNETTTVLNDNVEEASPTTTIINPVFPEEITEEPRSTTSSDKSIENPEPTNQTEDPNSDKIETTEEILTTTAVVKPLTKPYEVEPWKMRAVKTSTSTEVSHETEICYKGRCVKEKKKFK